MSNTSSAGRSSVTACLRCRQKKKRCDQGTPKCRLCRLAGVDCVGYDPIAGRAVPRSYVRSLEDRVAYLEMKLQERSNSNSEDVELDQDQRTPSTRQSTEIESEARGAANTVLNLAQNSPRQEPTFSKLFLSELMRYKTFPSLQRNGLTPEIVSELPTSSNPVVTSNASPATLPSRDTARNLVKAYFQLTKANMPLLHEPSFEQKLESLYLLPPTIDFASTHASTATQMAVFFVFEVFAVAVLSMQKRDPSTVPTSLADQYHRIALVALNEAGRSDNLEGVQALLLLAQYSYHHPTLWSVWKLVGAALRLAVELGLHQEPSPDSLDPLAIDIRRRTFWVAYGMDRNLSTALGLPTGLSDGAITVKFPNDSFDEFITTEGIVDPAEKNPSISKVLALHLLRYRQIQSMIQTVLQQHPPPPYGGVNYEQWQVQMRERIDAWYEATPPGDSLGAFEKGVVERFEASYQTAIFHLYRPSANIPHPSDSQLLTMAQAATRMIKLYRQFFREHSLTIYWQAMENVFSAGTSLLFGFVQSPNVRAFMSLSTLESLIHSCSSVLWGMAERFPSFQNKRDAFDEIVSKTLADLKANVAVNNGMNPGSGEVIDSNWWNSTPTDTNHSASPNDSLSHHKSIFDQSLGNTLATPAMQYQYQGSGDSFELGDFDASDFNWDAITGESISFPVV